MDFWDLDVGVLIVGVLNELGENRLFFNSDIEGLFTLIFNVGGGNGIFLVVGNDGGESAILIDNNKRLI